MNKALTLSLAFLLFFATVGLSQTSSKAQVSHARLLGLSKPLRNTVPTAEHTTKRTNKSRAKTQKASVPNFTQNKPMRQDFGHTAQPQGPDPLAAAADRNAATIQVIPALVVDGINENDSQIYPPDPNGYIGSTHYIQSANHPTGTVFEVFDKNGVSVYGPASTAPFWEEFGMTGFGDPVVVYDQEFDRWLITEFGPLGTSVFLIAVSETADPLGSWYAYEFQAPNFPDYPKYSVWNNAYFITSNEGGDDHIPVYALNRNQMIAGDDMVDIVRLPALPKFQANDAFQVAAPVCWDGPIPPPADEPGYIVRIYDDAWEGGEDGLELWKIHINWNDPDASVAEGPIFLETAPFDSKICNGSIFDCISEPDGSTMSVLEQVVMHRVQYRNFGAYESIVLNHVVDVDGNNLAGIRWYELRRVGGGDWTIYQQGTYAPDENHRFMGSIASDMNGNILMGYSVVGPDKFASLRFTGRLASDPLGEMTVEEYEFGTGLSNNPTQRIGDYACMTIDPLDNRTFWFTGEYMMQDGLWGTKIMKTIIQRDTNDIGPQTLVSPTNSGYLTNAEPVKVAIRNYGYNPASNFEVGLIFNGSLITTEVYTDTIQPDSVRFHTFATTVDMSAIGAYPFKIFTAYALDTTFVNDTLRVVVRQLPRNDAAIVGFTGLDFSICDTIVNAGIVLQNKGVDTLFSAIIHYQINGGNPFTINWVGVLPPGHNEVLPITFNEGMDGVNTLTASVELPNGVPDEDTSNDLLSRPFNMMTTGVGIVLELLTDNYPEETSWELFDDNGNLLYSGGSYSEPQTTYTVPMCVAESCYSFSIYDTFGDGMYWPGDNTMGNYVIYNAAGTPIANLANAGFGFQEDNDFCTDGTCSMEVVASVSHESAPGSGDGNALINVVNGVSPFRYSINDGVNYQSSPLFQNLVPGVYDFIVKDTSGCTMRGSFEIATCKLQSSIQIMAAATSNSNDGSIEVMVVDGYPPYAFRLVPGNFQSSPLFSNLDEGIYTVEATDSLGCVNTYQVTVEAITGTRTQNFGVTAKLFPNPTADGTFRVEINGKPEMGVVPVKIFNAQGQVVMNHRLVSYSGVLKAQITLKSHPSGVYFVQVYDEKAELNLLLKVVKS